MVFPSQITAPPAFTTGTGFTVTVTVLLPAHPSAEIPVTVYTVVTVGLAVTLGPVVPLSPVAGDHE